MDYIDREKLLLAIRREDVKMTEVAKMINTHYITFNRKMNHGYPFSETEIAILVKKFGKQIIK